MKKICILIGTLSLLAFPHEGKAQAAYQLNDNVIGLGIGLGSSLGNYTYSGQTPALNLQYERGLVTLGPGVLSGGLYVGRKTYKYSQAYYSYSYSQKWSYTIIGLRAAYHLQNFKGTDLKKWDLYAGLMLSYDALKYSYTDTDPYYNYNVEGAYGSHAGLSEFAGARYFFNSHIAVTGEVGYGISYLTLGLAYKF